jgi:uncharacterized membrane protein
MLALIAALAAGCSTPPSHTESDAVCGGLLGGITGAIIGHAAHNTAAGAAIGAGAGALAGAAIGSSQDQVEARNRAMIEAQLGRQVAVGAVTVPEVISMVQARVNDDLIINHIHAHGMAAPPNTSDLIVLQQNGVSPRVVQAMQSYIAPPPPPGVIVEQPAPPPVVVGGYWGPYYHRHYWY